MKREDLIKEKIKNLKKEVKLIVNFIGSKESEKIVSKEKRVTRISSGVKFEKPKSYITHGVVVEWKTGYTGYRKSLPSFKDLGSEIDVAIEISESDFSRAYKNFTKIVEKLDKTWKRVSYCRIEKNIRL